MKNRFQLTFKLLLFFTFLIAQSGILHSQACDPVRWASNKLSIVLDQDNDRLIFKDYECSACALGSVEASSTCLCRKSCKEIFSRDLKECQEGEEFDECFDIWEFETSIGDSYEPLEDACCPGLVDTKGDCLTNCGDQPENIRTPTRYFYSISLWYTTSLVETFEGAPNEQITSVDFDAPMPAYIAYNLDTPLPNQPVSYCYFTLLVIQYDDDSCCFFTDSDCVTLG